MMTSETSVLGNLLDVELDVTASIGTTSLTVAKILALGPDAVVEFARTVDEPIELRANGRLIAHGEIVAIDGRFGLRISSLATTTG